MLFSLAHLTALSCSPPDLVRLAARTGYDFVGLRIIYMGLPNEPDYDLVRNPGMYRETKNALADTGLRVHDIELAKIEEETDPRRYLPSFEVAAEMGCGKVIVSVWTPRRDIAVDVFREICDMARPLGLRIALEFVTFSELTTLADAISFLDLAKRDNAGLLIDTLHFQRSRVEPGELDAVPRDRFEFLHLSDAHADIPSMREALVHTARFARKYPGDGGIDLASIVHRIPDVVCSIELPNPVWIEVYGKEEHVRRCLEKARAYFAAHPR